MKYEIAYVSLSGNTEKLYHGIADSLPTQETLVTDIYHKEITKESDVHLIGFDVNKGTVSPKMMEVLDELHDKIVMFLVTCGMEPIREYRDTVEKKLLSFLPDDCEYLGMFMCQGKLPDTVLQASRNRLSEYPVNKSVRRILKESKPSHSHPTKPTIKMPVALDTVINRYLDGKASLTGSAKTQTEIDKQVVALVKRQYEKAKQIITENS